MKKFTGILLFVFAMLVMCETSYAKLPFVVRTIYFQPNDAPDADQKKISELMLNTQDFYRQEMVRHSYGPKLLDWKT